jgi:DNA invertase Pin-like site-specific DNA recombinase
MRKIGYARVSTSTQSLDRQIGALRAERCHEVYREKASGKATKGRPQLEKAIDALGTGDVLVVAEWDRATRSMMDGVHIIERINARGAMIKVLDKPHLDLTTPIGRGFIAFLSPLAEDERQRIVKRANDGRAAARKRGVHMGRKQPGWFRANSARSIVSQIHGGTATCCGPRSFSSFLRCCHRTCVRRRGLPY